MDVDWFHRAWPPAEDDPESVLTEADNMAAVWKLERDTKAWLAALRRTGGRGTGVHCRRWRSRSASTPRPARLRADVVARAVVHTLTSRRPRTRYPAAAGAKRLLFMRRVLPDRVRDRMVMRTVGLRSA